MFGFNGRFACDFTINVDPGVIPKRKDIFGGA
jgi:hypothetical protein